jgi:hypothetical protein
MSNANKHAPAFASRLSAARKLAQRLAEPAERVQTLTDEFSSQLHNVDEGFRVLIERAVIEARQDPNAAQSAREFFRAVRTMNQSAHSA